MINTLLHHHHTQEIQIVGKLCEEGDAGDFDQLIRLAGFMVVENFSFADMRSGGRGQLMDFGLVPSKSEPSPRQNSQVASFASYETLDPKGGSPSPTPTSCSLMLVYESKSRHELAAS